MTIYYGQTYFLIPVSTSSVNFRVRVTNNSPFKDCPHPDDHTIYYYTTLFDWMAKWFDYITRNLIGRLSALVI